MEPLDKPEQIALRDAMASAAMQGLASRSMCAGVERTIALQAYALADAMMEVRQGSVIANPVGGEIANDVGSGGGTSGQ